MIILGALFWTTTRGKAPIPFIPVDPLGFGYLPSGGIPDIPRRKRLKGRAGNESQALGIIEKVAHRQVEKLGLDSQQQLEELERELEVHKIEWKAEYLELLNRRREALIAHEIAFRMKQLQQDEEEISIALLLATL